MTPTEKILDKLQKIKAHADSAAAIGNEQEAQAFAGMLQQLLLKHKLEMSDLDYAKEMQDEPIIEKTPDTTWHKGHYVYTAMPDVEIVNRRVKWIEDLAYTISRYNACQYLIVEHRSMIYFVGHKSNVEICEYLFLTMLRAANSISDKAAKKYRREWRAKYGVGSTPGGFRESFLDGFIHRLWQRLQEEQDKFSGNTGMALVRVNKEALAVKNWVDNKFAGKKKAKAMEGSGQFNTSGYVEGQKLADSVNIKANGVKAGQPNQQFELED